MNQETMLTDAQRAFDEERYADADHAAREMIRDAKNTQRFDLIPEGFRIRARCSIAQEDFWDASCFFARAARYSKDPAFYLLAARTVLKETQQQLEKDKVHQAILFYQDAIDLLTSQGDLEELKSACEERDSLKSTEE